MLAMLAKYSSFILLCESGKCGKKGSKLQKCDRLESKKDFLDEIKSICHNF